MSTKISHAPHRALVVALLALSLTTASAESARAYALSSSAPDPTTDRLMQELCRFQRLARGGSLWPGYDPAKMPAVYLRARRGSLRPASSAAYLNVPGARSLPGGRVLRSRRCRSLTLIQARAPRRLRQAFDGNSPFTTVPMGDGQPLFAYLYGPRTELRSRSRLRRALLRWTQVGRAGFQKVLIHELFHAFEFTHMRVPDIDQESVNQLPKDATFAALGVLESYVISQLERARSEPRVRELARWFLSVRNARLSMSPAVRTFEESQEWAEGTAQLVEDRAALLSTGKRPSVPSGSKIQGYLADTSHFAGWLWSRRYYETGSTVGRTLERLDVRGWQTKITRGELPAQILRNSIGPIPDGILATVQSEFGWEELLQQVQAIPLEYRKPGS